MKIKIDSAGRIVLPKPVRDRYRLRTGCELELQESPQGIVLTPASQGPSLVRIDGLLVHTGKLSEGWDLNRLIEDAREERIRDIWGSLDS